jgi:hypothetical protein
VTTDRPPSSGLSARIGRVVFWLWVPVALFVGASLLAAHWVALPTPERDDERLLAALAQLHAHEERESWLVVHVLYAACACSGRVVDHLVDDPRPSGVVDKVLLVGTVPAIEERLANASFEIVRVTPRELDETYAIEGAPLLLVVDPDGVLRYRGGYTERKQSLAIRDVEIVERLVADGDVPALPLFGCAVSRRLRDVLDPLGLRSRASTTPE